MGGRPGVGRPMMPGARRVGRVPCIRLRGWFTRSRCTSATSGIRRNSAGPVSTTRAVVDPATGSETPKRRFCVRRLDGNPRASSHQSDITISEGITVKELRKSWTLRPTSYQEAGGSRNLRDHQPVSSMRILATDLSREFGASTSQVTYEEEAMQDVETAEEKTDLFRRPPVVTIMVTSITVRLRCSMPSVRQRRRQRSRRHYSAHRRLSVE